MIGSDEKTPDAPKRNKPGPKGPWKDTPEVISILRGHMQRHGDHIIACKAAGIDPKTYKHWKEVNPDFSREMDALEAGVDERVLGKAEDKDPWKVLKNRCKHYRDEEKQNLVVTWGEEVESPNGTTKI